MCARLPKRSDVQTPFGFEFRHCLPAGRRHIIVVSLFAVQTQFGFFVEFLLAWRHNVVSLLAARLGICCLHRLLHSDVSAVQTQFGFLVVFSEPGVTSCHRGLQPGYALDVCIGCYMLPFVLSRRSSECSFADQSTEQVGASGAALCEMLLPLSCRTSISK